MWVVPEHSAAAIVHIPKCAGTSLRRSIETLPGVVVGPKYHDPYLMARRPGGSSPSDRDPLAYTLEELAEVRRTAAVVMGHIGVRAYLDAGFDSIRILVREPRSRLLSLFDQYERMSDRPVEVGKRSDALVEFLESDSTRTQGNNFIYRMVVAGGVDDDTYDGPTSAGREGELLEFLIDEMSKALPSLTGAYWDHEVARAHADLVREQFPELEPAGASDFPEENVAPEFVQSEILSPAAQELMEQHTVLSRAVLEALVDAGLLTPRADEDLRADFEATAGRHGFIVA